MFSRQQALLQMLRILDRRVLPLASPCAGPSAASVVVASSQVWRSMSTAEKASKTSSLAQLRKKTGYSLSLCKKALQENEQDVDRARKWLEEQAQAQGWNKAMKLEGRNTTQGLIGVRVSQDGLAAAMVELNCETDFVAKNKQFHDLLNQVVESILAAAASGAAIPSSTATSLVLLNKGDLNKLEAKPDEGKTLGDLVALNIGQIGENIVLRRCALYKVGGDLKLSALTHPSASIHNDGVAYGRYGTIVSYQARRSGDPNGLLPQGQTEATMMRQLCQHIIGMNPSSLGNLDDPSTWPMVKKVPDNLTGRSTTTSSQSNEKTEEGVRADEDTSFLDSQEPMSNDCNEMIHQKFLLDPDMLVREVLAETGLKIKEFVRFEVGQGEDN